MRTEEDTGHGLFELFRELSEQLWQRLSSLIGETATAVVFRGAVREAARRHAVLSYAEVTEKGIFLELPGNDSVELEPGAVRAGLLSFVDSLQALLKDLTGDILLRKISPLVQEFRQQVEKE